VLLSLSAAATGGNYDKIGQRILRPLADLSSIAVIRHPLEFAVARRIVALISAVPVFVVIGIKLVRMIVQISL